MRSVSEGPAASNIFSSSGGISLISLQFVELFLQGDSWYSNDMDSLSSMW